MPVFRAGDGQAPAWCELSYFDIVRLSPGHTFEYTRKGPKEKIIVGEGACRIQVRDEPVSAQENAQFDITGDDAPFQVLDVSAPTTLIRMAGRWGDEVGGSGLFGVQPSEDTTNPGDPVDYPKQTRFDNHFHDCDEYWIIYAGSGIAASEDKLFEVGPGDCVVTGVGWHHDFPIVHEQVKAVFFETTMEDAKRHGHLWEHTNGPADPKPERV